MQDLEGFAKVPAQFPEVRILRLEPGDVLLITVPGRLSDAEFTALSSRMKAQFPDHPMGVLEGGATLDIVRQERTETGG